MENVIIIGSGPAGYTAAIYAARANLAPLLFEGAEPGGQLMTTTDVENYPGYAEGVLGPKMMEDLKKQAERFGTRIIAKEVTRVEFGAPTPPLPSPPTPPRAGGKTPSGRGGNDSIPPPVQGGARGGSSSEGMRTFRVWTDNKLYESRAIIISTGASAKRLGLENEKKLYGKGVSACATCDGYFFKDKIVVVIGGGDTAMEESLFLTKFAKKVYVVHRRGELRASKIMADRAIKNPKIEFIWNTVVEDVLGVDVGHVTGVQLKNLLTYSLTNLPCNGLFAAIGHEPNTKIFAGQIELDQKGYIVTRPGTTMTSVEGVFAGGDCVDHKYRQAVTAAGLGCMTAMDAERWLEGNS